MGTGAAAGRCHSPHRYITPGGRGRFAAAAESLSLFHTLGDRRWRMTALPALAHPTRITGDEPARQRYHAEMRQSVDQTDHPVLIPNLLSMGMDARLGGEFDLARLYFQDSLKQAKRLKSKFFVANLESELVHILWQKGELQEAKAGYQRTILTWNDLGQRVAVANQSECFAFIA